MPQNTNGSRKNTSHGTITNPRRTLIQIGIYWSKMTDVVSEFDSVIRAMKKRVYDFTIYAGDLKVGLFLMESSLKPVFLSKSISMSSIPVGDVQCFAQGSAEGSSQEIFQCSEAVSHHRGRAIQIIGNPYKRSKRPRAINRPVILW